MIHGGVVHCGIRRRFAACAIVLCMTVPAFAAAPAPETVPVPAPATTPARLDTAQSRQAQALLGFDKALPGIIELAFREQPQYATMTAPQRDCVRALGTPVIRAMFDEAIGEMFGDAATLDHWNAFSRTPGGAAFLAATRARAIAMAEGRDDADMATAMRALPDADRDAVIAFLGSPAGAVLRRGFPAAGLPTQTRDALNLRARQECGVELGTP